MTKLKIMLSAMLLIISIHSINAAPLTTSEKTNIEQQLNTVKANIIAATKKAQNGTFEDQLALAKFIQQQNTLKRKLAGR